MKNKQAKTSPALTFGIVVGVLAVIAILGFLVYNQTMQTQIGVDKSDVNIASCPESTGKITVNSFSALAKGTNITPTFKAGVNGGPVTTDVTSGTTAFAVGSKLQLVAALSDYIDTELTGTMECGGLTLDNPMFYSTSDNPAIRIKNDDGDYMSDNILGATVNQTNVAVGETIVLDVEFTGTSQESSGDGIYVIEFPASTSANITKVELGGLSPIAVPSVHTSQAAGSKIVAFDVSAISGSDKKVLPLTITLGATKDLTGGVYTDWYAKQKFIDTDGTVQYGIQDGEGTAKYENTLDFDFFINAA